MVKHREERAEAEMFGMKPPADVNIADKDSVSKPT